MVGVEGAVDLIGAARADVRHRLIFDRFVGSGDALRTLGIVGSSQAKSIVVSGSTNVGGGGTRLSFPLLVLRGRHHHQTVQTGAGLAIYHSLAVDHGDAVSLLLFGAVGCLEFGRAHRAFADANLLLMGGLGSIDGIVAVGDVFGVLVAVAQLLAGKFLLVASFVGLAGFLQVLFGGAVVLREPLIVRIPLNVIGGSRAGGGGIFGGSGVALGRLQFALGEKAVRVFVKLGESAERALLERFRCGFRSLLGGGRFVLEPGDDLADSSALFGLRFSVQGDGVLGIFGLRHGGRGGRLEV